MSNWTTSRFGNLILRPNLGKKQRTMLPHRWSWWGGVCGYDGCRRGGVPWV